MVMRGPLNTIKSIPYHTIPYPTIPYPTLPYHTPLNNEPKDGPLAQFGVSGSLASRPAVRINPSNFLWAPTKPLGSLEGAPVSARLSHIGSILNLGLSYGPLLWAPLTQVGSLLWTPVWYMVCNWYVLVCLGVQSQGPY